MKTLLVVALLGAGCNSSTELTLQVRLPADPRGLLTAVVRYDAAAQRDGRVIAQASFSTGARSLALTVAHGPRTVLMLDGIDNLGDVIGHGQTCPLDFESGGLTAPLYFAPTNFFAPTAGPPVSARLDPVAVPLADGTVLIAGGADGDGALASSELFSPASATFAAAAPTLTTARQDSEVTMVSPVGALVTGGVGPDGSALADAEVYGAGVDQFVALSSQSLGSPRVGHRAVVLTDGRVLITGGRTGGDATGQALATTRLIRVQPDLSAAITDGPMLTEAKYEHAAVVAIGIPLIIGGYSDGGDPLSTIEAYDGTAFQKIAALTNPRAEATASVLGDGSILIVGGAGDKNGTPRPDAELYNPYLMRTTVYALADARRGHTATLLPDGRLLVAGGVGADGKPLDSVELFTPGVGFVTEHRLQSPRAGHVAVPLCDGTVLVVGGGDGAELYTPPTS
jgi:hypothetical protein